MVGPEEGRRAALPPCARRTDVAICAVAAARAGGLGELISLGLLAALMLRFVCQSRGVFGSPTFRAPSAALCGVGSMGSAFEVDWNGYPLGSFPRELLFASRVRVLATVCLGGVAGVRVRSLCRLFVAPLFPTVPRTLCSCRKTLASSVVCCLWMTMCLRR